jgi:methionyl-tRNA formyltransferase
MRWSGTRTTRRSYQAICDIPLDIPRDELDRRLKIFGANHFGVSPTIHLHGIAFRAVTRPLPEQLAAPAA